MQKRNKIVSEISRMIDLSSFGSSNEKIIKESFKNKVNKNKKIIKENEDFDFLDDLDLLDDGDLTPEEKSKSNDSLPYPFKIALLSHSLNSLEANALGLAKNDTIELPDLKTKPVYPEPGLEGGEENRRGGAEGEKGAVYSKPSFDLYSSSNVEEFRRLLDKGRFVVKFKGHEEELGENAFKWLSDKSFNNIGMTKGSAFDLSPRGKATLDFLARIASGQPNEDEKQLSELKGAKEYAYKILSSFYKLAGQKIISTMISGDIKNVGELVDDANDGMEKALRALYGIIGADSKIRHRGKGEDEDSKGYSPEMSIGPWLFQIAKNHVKDQIKSRYEYVPNLEKAQEELENRMNTAIENGTNEFIIPSKVFNKESNARVEKVENAGKTRFLYYYDDIDDALEDLSNKAPHMKGTNLYKEETRSMFDNVRRVEEAGLGDEDASVEMENPFGNESSQEIKNLLKDAVEWMVTEPKYRLKDAFSILDVPKGLNPEEKANAEAAKKWAQGNLVNFIFGYLIQMGGNESDSGDIEDSGKAKKETLRQWIYAFNIKTFEKAMKQKPGMDGKKLVALLKKKGFWINDDMKNLQNIYSGIKDYFGGKAASADRGEIQNKDAFEKILNLVSSADFEQERDFSGMSLNERKLREKIRQKLMESFILKEEEDVFNIDLETIKTVGEKFKKFLKDEKYDETSIDDLNNEIIKILSTGKGAYSLDVTSSSGKTGITSYLMSVLASLFELVDGRKKNNIISYMFESFFPNGENSNAAMFLISRFSGKDLKKPIYKEIAWDSVTRGSKESGKTTLEEALEDYNPERGADFVGWLFNKIANRTKSRIQNKFSHTDKGKREYQDNVSMDDKVSSSSDSETHGDRISSSQESGDEVDDKSQALKIIRAFLSFMNEKLGSKQALKDILRLLGNNEVYNEKGKLDNKLIANILDASVGSIRKNKNSLTKVMKDAIDSGEMRKYILDEAGKDINKYPKIQNFLETGDLTIGDYGQSGYDDTKNDSNDEDESEDDDDFMFESFIKQLNK